MSPEELIHIIQNSTIQVSEPLQSLVKQYPYCQNIRFAYLKKLNKTQHSDFNNQLPLTATYALDRAFLYYFLNKADNESNNNSSDILLPPLPSKENHIEEETLELTELPKVEIEKEKSDELWHEEASPEEIEVVDKRVNDFSPPDDAPDEIEETLETALLENVLKTLKKEEIPILEEKVKKETKEIELKEEKKEIINPSFIVQEIMIENNRLAKGHHIEEDVDNFLHEEDLEEIDAAVEPKELATLDIFSDAQQSDLNYEKKPRSGEKGHHHHHKVEDAKPLHKVIYDKIKVQETSKKTAQPPQKKSVDQTKKQKIKAFFKKIEVKEENPNVAKLEPQNIEINTEKKDLKKPITKISTSPKTDKVILPKAKNNEIESISQDVTIKEGVVTKTIIPPKEPKVTIPNSKNIEVKREKKALKKTIAKTIISPKGSKTIQSKPKNIKVKLSTQEIELKREKKGLKKPIAKTIFLPKNAKTTNSTQNNNELKSKTQNVAVNKKKETTTSLMKTNPKPQKIKIKLEEKLSKPPIPSKEKSSQPIDAFQFVETPNKTKEPVVDYMPPSSKSSPAAIQNDILIFNNTPRETAPIPKPKKKKAASKNREKNKIKKKTQIKSILAKIAQESLKEDKAVISETLAQLLEVQGKEAKALKMYHQLILKNPQKSSYFAEKIKKLLK